MATTVTRPVTRKATAAEVMARVEHIAELMTRGKFVRGETPRELAQEWGLAVNTVEHDAAEASRLVISRIRDPERLKQDVSTVLVAAMHRAFEEGDYGNVARNGDVVTRINGARVPERTEHAHAVVVSHFDGLPTDGKVAWLRERAAQCLELADRLEQEQAVAALPPPKSDDDSDP